MRSGWLVLATLGACGCISNWGYVGDLASEGPDAPSALAGCAAGGSVADAELSGVLCTSPTDLLTGPLGNGNIVLLPGPIALLAPRGG